MKKTKAEVEEAMKRLAEENELSTLFVCCLCNDNLIGMKEVRKHVDRYKHYEYKNPKHPRVRLSIG